MKNRKDKQENIEDIMKYTVSQLLNEILEEQTEENISNDENIRRECQYKKKVIQSIINLNLNDSDYKEIEKGVLKNKIDISVDGNEQLFGYTFFLSANPNFDYSWNFLRKQMEYYKTFLLEVCTFINQVVENINTMHFDLKECSDIEIVFHNLLRVKFINVSPWVKTTINWNNFYQITDIKGGYYISAKLKKTTVLTCYQVYGGELKSFINEVNQMVITYKQNSDKNGNEK